jgi:homoserine O-succinyltransferase
MPLLIDRGGTPTRWTGNGYLHTDETQCANGAGHLEIALINNMPDAAIEDTEMQFFGLLGAAAGRISIHAKLYSISSVPRSERAENYLKSHYNTVEELLSRRFDGVIITGTEPKLADLRQEPYWGALTEVMDWAEENTSSTILSCLAAHAGVLHSDGIGRSPLSHKRFGVFDHRPESQHPLTDNNSQPIRIPHSRWNEVREDALCACGYDVLTKSQEAGVDLFVKHKKQSLFVHFQGHPEYGERTLLKEYRRDVKRYLRQERDSYPLVPHGYFDDTANELINKFQSRVMADRREEIIESFPESEVAYTLEHRWRASATNIYKNWLQYMISKRVEAPLTLAMATVGRS